MAVPTTQIADAGFPLLNTVGNTSSNARTCTGGLAALAAAAASNAWQLPACPVCSWPVLPRAVSGLQGMAVLVMGGGSAGAHLCPCCCQLPRVHGSLLYRQQRVLLLLVPQDPAGQAEGWVLPCCMVPWWYQEFRMHSSAGCRCEMLRCRAMGGAVHPSVGRSSHGEGGSDNNMCSIGCSRTS